MIQILKNVTKTWTATADTQVQRVKDTEVEFQTDNAAEVWGILENKQILSIPSGKTVYFKAKHNTKLATIEV